jgi:hypothetical protein
MYIAYVQCPKKEMYVLDYIAPYRVYSKYKYIPVDSDTLRTPRNSVRGFAEFAFETFYDRKKFIAQCKKKYLNLIYELKDIKSTRDSFSPFCSSLSVYE